MEVADELVRIARRYFEAGASGEVAGWVEAHLGDPAGFRLIGTDAGEVRAGAEAVAYLLSGDGHVAGVTVDLLHLEAFHEGAVGWVFASPRITRAGHAPVDLRWTAVFVRRSTRWEMAQVHVSQAGAPGPA